MSDEPELSPAEKFALLLSDLHELATWLDDKYMSERVNRTRTMLVDLTAEVDRLSADLADAQYRIGLAFSEHPQGYNADDDAEDCTYCEVLWPCPTVRALSAGGDGRDKGDER